MFILAFFLLRIRRMASTFADPVNLGAFLLAVFLVSWHRGKGIICVLMAIGMLLTVSKGAWLGMSVFFCVYAYFYWPKPAFYMMLGVSGLIGFVFLIYAYKTSANSVFLHISGLTAAFRGLIKHPLGSGLGSNSVLAKQFSGFSSNAEVTETGLGMVISQLGIFGLIIYVVYFKKLIDTSLHIENKKDAVLVLSLLLSVILNIFFNEVALSPNTCAVYFLITGYYVAKVKDSREVQSAYKI